MEQFGLQSEYGDDMLAAQDRCLWYRLVFVDRPKDICVLIGSPFGGNPFSLILPNHTCRQLGLCARRANVRAMCASGLSVSMAIRWR